MVTVQTAVRLIPRQGGVMHPVVVAEQSMGGALHKGVLREDGVRRCPLQGDGRCRPGSGGAAPASWRVDFSKFYFFSCMLLWVG